MKRTLLLTAGWCVAVGTYYGCFLVLDLYWNIIDWRFRLDLVSGGALSGIPAGLLTLWLLVRATHSPAARTLALLLCLVLIAAAVNSLRAEPLAGGLLTRHSPSPSWYRLGRLLLMSLPALFWFAGPRQRKPEGS